MVLKGSYLLVIYLPQSTQITVGKLGKHNFPKGYYIYVGSAMNSLFGRVSRHLRENKQKHWHIDYLLEYAKPLLVLMIPSTEKIECKLASMLSGKVVVEKFGSTDCNCKSHLFYYEKFEKLVEDLRNLLLKVKNYSLSIL